MGESHRATNRAVTSSSVFSRRPRPRQCFGNKALMPPWHRAHFSRSQSRLRCLRHEERRRQRNGAAAHLRAAVERIALRGPRRSLRIEWLRYNAPSLTTGQAPWYRLILFGEEGYGSWGYPLDGYTVIVGDEGALTFDGQRSRRSRPEYDTLMENFSNMFSLGGGRSHHRHYTGGPYQRHTGHDHAAALRVLQIRGPVGRHWRAIPG